jgi:hypothetical protein
VQSIIELLKNDIGVNEKRKFWVCGCFFVVLSTEHESENPQSFSSVIRTGFTTGW